MNSSTFIAALASAIVAVFGTLFVLWKTKKMTSAVPPLQEQLEAERRAAAERWAKEEAARASAVKEERKLVAAARELEAAEAKRVAEKLGLDPVDRANERLKKLREKE